MINFATKHKTFNYKTNEFEFNFYVAKLDLNLNTIASNLTNFKINNRQTLVNLESKNCLIKKKIY